MRYYIFLLFITACGQTKSPEMKNHKFTNSLINETSPYLLQHAHNPVDWYPWNDETLEKAKKEDKMILISIGYSSCHWCHVMEEEVFENEEAAKLMNDNFICIKVDREEMPNVDQVYMDAVQILTGSGGWPLNCIALPNGKPFWGGTYFPLKNWKEILYKIVLLRNEDPDKINEYAEKLSMGIYKSNLIELNAAKQDFSKEILKEIVTKWTYSFDQNEGGYNRAPKFPMPNNYSFLLQYGYLTQDKEILSQVEHTLDKITNGGIYDHIGGGFARYSVDARWHIPHFEKMLYDNSQMVSLLSDAYKYYKKDSYKIKIEETLEFVKNNWLTDQGAFYSSFDADSNNKEGELEEGAYYVWNKEELKELLKDDFDLFAEFYQINEKGYWEEGNYNLIVSENEEIFSTQKNIQYDEFLVKTKKWKNILSNYRDQNRSKPRLDDKIICSWNALMLKGYIDAYISLGEEEYLEIAIKNASFIEDNMLDSSYKLSRIYSGNKASISAYLEDYACLIDAYLSLYQATFDTHWLSLSKSLTDYCLDHFYDAGANMFYFSSNLDKSLFASKMDIEDNVISSSNSIMANNLNTLSYFYYNDFYKTISSQMLQNIMPKAQQYGAGYSNWLSLYIKMDFPFYQIAIMGGNALDDLEKVNRDYFPNKIIGGSTELSSTPLLKDRYKKDKDLLYLCIDKVCKQPVETISELKKLIN